MLQKQIERVRGNRADTKESYLPNTGSTERNRKLQQPHKGEPAVASTSTAAQAIYIDTDNRWSTQNQAERKDQTPYMNRQNIMNLHDSSEMQ